MSYLYLVLSLLFNAMGAVAGKWFNVKNEGKIDSSPLYNLVQSISACLVFGVMFLVQFSFDVAVLPYAIGYGVGYALWMIGLINALKTGPASLTTLTVTMSLLVTVLWGFLFWGEKPDGWCIAGLVLVVASMVLCLTADKKEEKKLSLKWLGFTALSFFANASCVIVQRTQQLAFDGKHGGQLMFFATLMAVIVCLVLYLKSNKQDSGQLLKTAYFPVAAGVSNGLCNVCFLLLAVSELPAALVYPVNGVGALALVVLASALLFKEKLTAKQIAGIVLGIAATALLSL